MPRGKSRSTLAMEKLWTYGLARYASDKSHPVAVCKELPLSLTYKKRQKLYNHLRSLQNCKLKRGKVLTWQTLQVPWWWSFPTVQFNNSGNDVKVGSADALQHFYVFASSSDSHLRVRTRNFMRHLKSQGWPLPRTVLRSMQKESGPPYL